MGMCVKSPPIMHNAGRGRGKIFVFESLIWLSLAVQTAAARPVSVSAPLLEPGREPSAAPPASAGLCRHEAECDDRRLLRSSRRSALRRRAAQKPRRRSNPLVLRLDEAWTFPPALPSAQQEGSPRPRFPRERPKIPYAYYVPWRQLSSPACDKSPVQPAKRRRQTRQKKSAGVVLRQLGPSRSIRFVSGRPQRQSPRSSEFRETPSPTTIAADRIMTPSSPGSTGPQSWRNVFSSCHRDAAAPKRRARGLRLRGHGGRAAAAREDDSGAISRQRR